MDSIKIYEKRRNVLVADCGDGVQVRCPGTFYLWFPIEGAA
jgi:hypothetical protein